MNAPLDGSSGAVTRDVEAGAADTVGHLPPLVPKSSLCDIEITSASAGGGGPFQFAPFPYIYPAHWGCRYSVYVALDLVSCYIILLLPPSEKKKKESKTERIAYYNLITVTYSEYEQCKAREPTRIY